MRYLCCFCFYLFYRCSFIDTPLLFTCISTLKIIVLVTGGYFVMINLLSSKDITVTKCPPVIRTNLFKRNISLPTVDDKYSFTRARNALAFLITSIESLETPSYWYNISHNVKVVYVNYFDLKVVCFYL